MGVPPTGQVAISVAQRGVLQNPGGATGQLQGVGAPTQKRGLSRDNFRKEIAARQINTGDANSGGTPTNNNPVATQLLLSPTFTPVQANAVLDQANMRIAVPVRQVDGEYILVMQMMGAAAQAAPQAAGEAAPAAPAPAAESTPRPAAGAEPAAASASAEPAAEASPAAAGESAKPAAESGKPTEGETGKPAGEPATPASESSKPTETESSKTAESDSSKPTTDPANPPSSADSSASASASPAATKPSRRQSSDKKDKYGQPEAPAGAVMMSMKDIDTMAAMVTWGGQAPITQMMNEYVKAQTGKGLDSPGNGTAVAAGLVEIGG